MKKPLVRIAYNSARAAVRSDDKSVYRLLDDCFTYYEKGFQWSWKYKSKRWDGKVHLYALKENSFPAGFLERAVKYLKKRKYRIKLYDQREPSEVHPALADAEILFDYRIGQEEAVETGLARTRGIFEGATGWGKTNLMAAMIARIGSTALVLVNRNEIAQQTVERFRGVLRFPHANDPYGLIGGGKWTPGIITVASYQTLHRMLRDAPQETEEWLKQFQQVHFDEAHHVPAKTFYKLSKALGHAYWRFGYSATPFKSDKETELRVVATLGEIIYSFNVDDAIDAGILVPPRIFMVDGEFPLLPGHDMLDGNYEHGWMKCYQEGIERHLPRQKLIAKLAELVIQHKLPCLLLLTRKKQAHKLLNYLADYNVEFFDGESTGDERRDGLKRLGEGKLDLVIATTIFDEGVDLPALGALILAGGMKADHLTMQRIGRGLRAAPGKSEVLVFDFWDSHGSYIKRHSELRLKTYKKFRNFKVTRITAKKLVVEMKREKFWVASDN